MHLMITTRGTGRSRPAMVRIHIGPVLVRSTLDFGLCPINDLALIGHEEVCKLDKCSSNASVATSSS
jgi:hypothetical protein